MIASLPMYMRSENQSAHENYWQTIRHYLIEHSIQAPETLSDVESLNHWLRSDLILSQTCGMPYRLHLHDQVQLVGTPDYGLQGCPPGYYYSVIIAHANDERSQLSDYHGAKFAVNDTISQSGYAAAINAAQPLGINLTDMMITGAHVASAKAVADKQAEFAAIDVVTWGNIKRYDSFSHKLKIITQTEPTPGLPYICGLDHDAVIIRHAVEQAINDLDPSDRQSLGITSLIDIPKSHYLNVN